MFEDANTSKNGMITLEEFSNYVFRKIIID